MGGGSIGRRSACKEKERVKRCCMSVCEKWGRTLAADSAHAGLGDGENGDNAQKSENADLLWLLSDSELVLPV